MKQPSLKKSVLVALVLLQCTNIAFAQQHAASGGVADAGSGVVASAADVSSNNPPAATTTVPTPITTTTVAPTIIPPVVTTTTVASTTTINPPVVPTTTTDTPVAPTSTTPAPTTDPIVPTSAATTTSNSRMTPNRSSAAGSSAALPSTSASSGAPPQASPTGNSNAGQGQPDNSGKTAIIAGSVVGGIVGLALIAGLITWCNRRGGCTSRTRRRDAPEDFEAHNNDYDIKMTENHNMGGVTPGLGMAAAGGAMHSSDNLPPPSPFQHARRFVPPTSNPTGYMNLTDEEYGYHQNNTNAANYQPQAYQDYNNAGVPVGSEYDYQHQQQQHGYEQHSHPDYNQEHQQEYHHDYQQQGQEFIPHHEYQHDYQHDGSVTGGAGGYQQQQGYYNHGAPVVAGSNFTSPTLTNATTVVNDGYRQQLKPDLVEQKPNAA